MLTKYTLSTLLFIVQVFIISDNFERGTENSAHAPWLQEIYFAGCMLQVSRDDFEFLIIIWVEVE